MKNKNKKDKTVNSHAYAYLKSLVHPTIKIVDLYVRGKWLTA